MVTTLGSDYGSCTGTETCLLTTKQVSFQLAIASAKRNCFTNEAGVKRVKKEISCSGLKITCVTDTVQAHHQQHHRCHHCRVPFMLVKRIKKDMRNSEGGTILPKSLLQRGAVDYPSSV